MTLERAACARDSGPGAICACRTPQQQAPKIPNRTTALIALDDRRGAAANATLYGGQGRDLPGCIMDHVDDILAPEASANMSSGCGFRHDTSSNNPSGRNLSRC